MADTPDKSTMHAKYEARLIHASWHTVERSRMLLARTRLLVTDTEGGSAIGMRLPNLGECELAEGMKQDRDG